jgi:hypothetical protein
MERDGEREKRGKGERGKEGEIERERSRQESDETSECHPAMAVCVLSHPSLYLA